MLEPETGIALARVIAASVGESADAGTRAEARRLLGKAYFLLRDNRAEEILARSAADFERAKEAGTVFDWAHALQTLQLLSRTQTDRGGRNRCFSLTSALCALLKQAAYPKPFR